MGDSVPFSTIVALFLSVSFAIPTPPKARPVMINANPLIIFTHSLNANMLFAVWAAAFCIPV